MTMQYDLFISYDEDDETWVNEHLLSGLEQAGINFHTEAAFTLGLPRLREFERAIKKSRYTLLVVSPAYIQDNLSDFIQQLAITHGVETDSWPVIPLIRKTEIEMPLQLKQLVALDATEPINWPTEFAKLLRHLNTAAPPPDIYEPLPFEPDLVELPSGPLTLTNPQARAVQVDAFQIGKAPVTNDHDAEFIRQTARPAPRRAGWQGNRPPRSRLRESIVGISWYDARDYCRWLSKETGRPYRLPTEAEWVKAIQHVDGQTYMWGKIWEWTSTPWGRDWQNATYRDPTSDGRDLTDNLEADANVMRILRGRAYVNGADTPKADRRFWFYQDATLREHGFRVALERVTS